MKKLSPEEGYARYAFEYDDKEKYWDSFEHGCFDPYLKMIEGKEVLDAGAGTGRLSMKMLKAGANVTALDVSAEMLQKIQQKTGQIETVLADMEAMPFADNSFDFVFSSMAMVHLKKVDRFLDECYRIVKEGGLVCILNIHYRKPLILRDGQGATP
ncbi:class I SAM-dependent methyltransferase [Candidatus Peregrinibacteria bacterium]|nr:MAG: class I SAM-dependent methyltransferase [Candidatus Peregrinibacteria bacterium]